jgi:hypothetical protein
MNGRKAKKLRKIAGFKPGTIVRYMVQRETGVISCTRPRALYKRLKKSM